MEGMFSPDPLGDWLETSVLGRISPPLPGQSDVCSPTSNVTSDIILDVMPPSKSAVLMSSNGLEGNIEPQVSRIFHAGRRINGRPPDCILLSSDGINFFFHASMASATTLGEHNRCRVQADAAVLNIILHTLYNLSCAQFQPSFESLALAVERMQVDGMDPRLYITPKNPTFDVLLRHAPFRPLELFALAAHLDIYDLAVPTSSHLLSLKLFSLSDDICERIGSKYLARLYNLHTRRVATLKALVSTPPARHAETPRCGTKDWQERLVSEWSLTVAYLCHDATPEMSASFLVSKFSPIKKLLSCKLCVQALEERLNQLSRQWAAVKCTI
ncbi:hypothetical protein BDZ89DRAFT_1063817 [Hymenopellis radicata]|nr:hypothetical protein BDZ89DRAFT_1063817 [Hymenopellis radicata]